MATRRSTRRGSGTARDYPRTARLNELVREIVADELERIDDERLTLLTVISVEVESDMRHAVVFFDCLDGAEGDDEAIEALGESRWRLQGAIARQTRIKRTPELTFRPDPAVRSGELIDGILATIEPPAEDDEEEPGGDDGTQPPETRA
jgi:ribosome-binding factor A